MGEFQSAVSTLLDAFAGCKAIIKTQRGARCKTQKTQPDPTHQIGERYLSQSLEKDRTDIKKAYAKDLAQFGPCFAAGDTEAHSSLSAILLRLTAGFVSIIQRFTAGHSNPTDYQALTNLSNASRIEAINTFEQLSNRLSRSSLSPVDTRKFSEKHNRTAHKRNAKKSSSGRTKRSPPKSAAEFSTPAQISARTEGEVRSKTGRKSCSDFKSSKFLSPNQPILKAPSATRAPKHTSRARIIPTNKKPMSPSTPETRKSVMSFASDSTKLGEIPERKWTRRTMVETTSATFPMTTYYPLEPYQEPEKKRSRLMKLFGR